MGIKFCTKCNGLVISAGKNAVCLSCKTIQEMHLIADEKPEVKKEVSVINEKDSIILPKVFHPCKKCGEEYAYFWSRSTYSDEADANYYKCIKCGYAIQKGGQSGGN